ncbi:hypothetical protein VTG60DRAFT_2216 [Thermothelomyces hinnuleus]
MTNAAGSVPAQLAATTRNLRPRQASGAPGSSVGGAAPKAGGRVTRSSATLLRTSSANENSAAPQPQVLDNPKSHKRSQSSVGNARQQAKRTRLTPHKPGFYGESSDSGGDSDSLHETPGPDVEQKAGGHQRCKPPKNSTPKKSSKPARATIRSPRKLASEKSPASEGNESAGENGIIPDWGSLPYHILVQIFRYAAAPLNQVQQAKWLTATSGVCRAFAEPALTALYRAPPLLTRPMAHGLVSLLCKDPSTTLFNYRQKVEELWIDVEHIASKTFKGQPLDLPALVGNLPRLKSIQFFHQKDDPPYRSLDGSLRWHYPPALFKALSGTRHSTEEGGTINHAKLLGWQWNRRLMGPDLDLAAIKVLHETPPFLSLEKVSFVNYQVPSLHAGASVDDEELAARDEAFIQGMADAITALPALKHLAIESSTVANSQLLLRLPDRLETLELVNCWEVNGDDFADYLLSRGHHLKQLTLRHNQSLSLSFVTVLGTACPNLEVLSMDFKTFKHHEFYHDSDPSYDDLLTANQVPDWPQSLETLQLLNMKKWTAEAAETLFQSLVDSAPRLLKLRWLELKAMLSIPIQERSRMRNKWGCKLRQVFLRENEEPKPLFSLREKPRPPDAEKITKRTPKKSRKLGGALPTESPSRRSSRIAGQSSNSSSRAGSIGRELRHGLSRPSYAEPDTDEDEGGEEGDDEKDAELGGAQNTDRLGTGNQPESVTSPADAEALFRHGMCEKVEIQLDNQKSAETTLTMDDFLDSGNDDLSDDDWVGQDDESDNGYAW